MTIVRHYPPDVLAVLSQTAHRPRAIHKIVNCNRLSLLMPRDLPSLKKPRAVKVLNSDLLEGACYDIDYEKGLRRVKPYYFQFRTWVLAENKLRIGGSKVDG